MTIKGLLIRIRCDAHRCPQEIHAPHNPDNDKNALQVAIKFYQFLLDEGWEDIDGKHYCPLHPQGGDAPTKIPTLEKVKG